MILISERHALVLKAALLSRAVRAGVAVLAGSFLAFFLWQLFSPVPACDAIAGIQNLSGDSKTAGLLVVFVWSALVFCTVLPLGTVTVLIAGYIFGPVAGLVQFCALFVASLVLYEVGRDRDQSLLAQQIEASPALSRLVASAGASGLWISIGLRLLPVVPSAGAALTASFLQLTRTDFLLGTVLAGWVRPLGFAYLGSLGRFVPICGIGSV